MKKFYMLSATWVVLMVAQNIHAQLVIDGATLVIESGAVVSVQGNLSSTSDIQGPGKIVMNGVGNQQINMNGNAIPVLEINNAANINLTGNMRLSSNLILTNGRIIAGVNNFTFSPSATFIGAGAGKYIETNDIGLVRKEVTSAGSYVLPIGTLNGYMPLQYDLSGNTFGGSALVSGLIVPASHPKKPVRATDFFNAYWKPSYTNITGGTVNVTTTYNDANSYDGSESFLNGLTYDGVNWSFSNNTINPASNTVTYNGVASGTDLYAMNKFILMNAKVFLQGPYNASTGKMNDALRAGTNIIPLTDPYRTALYSSFFTHFNNPIEETASPLVFSNQTNDDDNIVDWVFLELRNSSSALIQTRSALLQKDGDVVDVDGITPVFFKNLDGGSYVITVRHRNHLGLSVDASTYAKSLTIANPGAGNIYDLRTATNNQLFGTAAAYSTATHPTLGNVNLLWAGNASPNGNVKYNGPGNDQNQILNTKLGGSLSTILSNVYLPEDVNMDRIVKWNGPNNDQNFLLNITLGGSLSTVILQQIY